MLLCCLGFSTVQLCSTRPSRLSYIHTCAVNACGPTMSPLQGVGSGERITAQRCELAEVRLGGCRFRAVHAVYHSPPPSGSSGGGAGLELSQHTSGIVCAGLLGRCALTFDYARMRVAVAGPPSLSLR